MSVQAIIDALFANIVADSGGTGVYTAVGGRIKPVEGKQNLALPHIGFFVASAEPRRYHNATTGQNVLVQFDIYADRESGADNASDIESKLYARLENTALSPSGYGRAVCTFVTRGSQVVDEDAIRLTDQIQIQAH